MNTIFFSQLNENSVIPTKRVEDAGYDFYANFEEDSCIIEPGEIVGIKTGIATAFSDDYALIFKERGSTGILGLSVRSGVIDSGYRGEIIIVLNNTSNKVQEITKLTKSVVVTEDRILYPYIKAIAQGIVQYVPKLLSEVISYSDLLNIKSERMFEKLGQSGK